jgi:regulatory protein
LTKAKNAAYRLLTYRPRSRAELAQKLQDRQFPAAVIEAVLDDLVRFGYVNDRQFAEQFASSRIRLRGFGRRRIEVELRNKGIDRQIINEALAGVLDIDAEIDTAKKAAERKLNTMKAADREAKYRRLAGFLERRGFSYDVIRIVLRNTE